jgi:hypothetical protein
MSYQEIAFGQMLRFWCDAEGCMERCSVRYDETPDGWHVSPDGDDFCPAHSARIRARSTEGGSNE